MVQLATDLEAVSKHPLTFCSLEKPWVGRRNSFVIFGSAWKINY